MEAPKRNACIRYVKLDKLGSVLNTGEENFEVQLPAGSKASRALIHNGYPILVFEGGDPTGHLRPRQFRVSKSEKIVDYDKGVEQVVASLSWGNILLTIIEIAESRESHSAREEKEVITDGGSPDPAAGP